MEQTLTAPPRWTLAATLEHPLHRLRLGYAAWLFGAFCYFLPAATWNPVSRFDLTRSIVERHSLNIDHYVDNTGDRARRGDHWYSDKAPLASLLAVPAYQAYHWLERSRGRAPSYEVRASAPGEPPQKLTVNRSFQRALYVCSLSTAALAGVGLGLALFELLRRRVSTVAALAGSAATVLATPLFPYATSFYGHILAAAFLSSAVVWLDSTRSTASASPSTAPEAPSRGRALAAGACLAASVGCEYLSAVPAAVVLAVFLLGVVRRSPAPLPRALARCGSEWVVPLALGALGPLLLLAAYHWACFGAPWRTGYSFIVDPRFAAGHASGLLGIRLPTLSALWGLSFGRLRGLFYVSPLALALAVGCCARARRDPTALAALCALLALLLVNGSYYMWWGGAAAAPRHLIPALGLLALGMPWLWQHRWLRPLSLLLALVGLVNMLAISAVGLEAPEHGDVLRDFVYQRLLSGRLAQLTGASNLGIEFGVVRGGSLGPLLAWLLIGAQMLYRQVRELEAEDAAAVAAVSR
jgi:hypothetical protein